MGDDRFGEVVTAMVVTQLMTLLRDNSRFLTVFAPTDAAFRRAPPDLVERILQDKHVLESQCIFFHNVIVLVVKPNNRILIENQ